MPFVHHQNANIDRESVCVLYEPDTGKVRHMHVTIVHEGGHNPSDAEVEEMAHTVFGRRGAAHAHLHALHVPHKDVAPGIRYRVDVQEKRLVGEAREGSAT